MLTIKSYFFISEKLKTSLNWKFISTELSTALDLAISKAPILLSIAVILALEFFAIDTAIQPEPVPISSTEIKSCNKIYWTSSSVSPLGINVEELTLNLRS